MTWFSAPASEDQLAVIGLVESLAKHFDDADAIGSSISMLVDSGIWSIGVDESLGGGGAPHLLLRTALAALAPHRAGLAWAMAQAHTAVDIVGHDARVGALVDDIVNGRASACVVDSRATHVRLTVEDNHVSGTIDRLDTAVIPVHIVVLVSPTEAWLLSGSAVTLSMPLDTTGFLGATTVSAEVHGHADTSWQRICGIDVHAARERLLLAGAAVAVGLAGEAMARALKYAEERLQFGAPLTALPTVRHDLTLHTSRTAAAWASIAGSGAPRPAGPLLSSCCETAIAATAAAIQIHGGYGYLTEYGIERLARQALSLRAAVDASGALRAASNSLAPTLPR
jgi:alkylation response protein AidB-like acyl-CoA dehydrogenase